MKAERRFSHEPRSVRDARRFVAEHLDDADQETAERMVLLVSELATNVVRHAETDFLVVLTRTGGVWRVEVHDTGPGQPTVQRRDSARSSGRGLQLVNDLADDWGVRQGRGGTKAVWFTLG